MGIEQKIIKRAYLIAKNSAIGGTFEGDIIDNLIRLEDDLRVISELLYCVIDSDEKSGKTGFVPC